jgi:hypothetical protein
MRHDDAVLGAARGNALDAAPRGSGAGPAGAWRT